MMSKKEEYVPLSKLIGANAHEDIGKLIFSKLGTEIATVPEVAENHSSAIAATAAAITPKISAASLVEAIRQRRHWKFEDVRTPIHPASAVYFEVFSTPTFRF